MSIRFLINLKWTYFYHFFNHDIGIKNPPSLIMINLCRETCWTYKVGSFFSTGFSPFTRVKIRTPDHLIKVFKFLISWTAHFMICQNLYLHIFIYSFIIYKLLLNNIIGLIIILLGTNIIILLRERRGINLYFYKFTHFIPNISH